MNIIFPDRASDTLKNSSRGLYYRTHYQYVRQILQYPSNTITLKNESTSIDTDNHNTNFICELDGKKFLIDYSDHIRKVRTDLNITYFKFHTSETDTKEKAFPPISFYDWNWYNKNVSKYSLNQNGKIFYKTRSYGAAIERRNMVRTILENAISVADLDTIFEDQETYFINLHNCFLNIVVPGARIDILDRTHMQSFALGIPVITPKLSTMLPYGQKFLPDIDYIKCKDDFSDLLEKIEWCKNNKKLVNEISNNCKTKFKNFCTPYIVQKWVLDNI